MSALIFGTPCLSAKMIDIVVHTNSIMVENPQTDPHMYIATLYFDRDIFISSIPQSLFDETKNFLPTKAQINFERPSAREELEYISNRYVYIILHGITPPKKGKKPADNVSYPELTLIPNLFYQRIDIQKHLLTSDNKHSTIDVEEEGVEIEMINATPGQNTIVKLNYSYKITLPNPNFFRLQPFGLAVSGVQINGLFQSFKPSFTSIPLCGWNCKLEIPSLGESLELANNGFLTSKQNPTPNQETKEGEDKKHSLNELLQNYNDLLTIGQQRQLQLKFLPATPLINNQLIETAFDSLYGIVMDPKNVDKQKQADVKVFIDKLTQYYATKLNLGMPAPGGKDKKAVSTPEPKATSEATFQALLIALKDAVAEAFNVALKEYNEAQAAAAAADPKKKAAAAVSATTFVLEGDAGRFPLSQEERPSNSKVFYLTKTQTDALRQSALGAEATCRLAFELDEFWGEAFAVERKNFIATCRLDLQRLKQRGQFAVGGLILQMTEEQKQLELQQNKPPSAGAGKKEAPKDAKKGGGPEPLNVLARNRAVCGVFVNFGRAAAAARADVLRGIARAAPGFATHVLRLRDLAEARQVKATWLQAQIFEVGAHLPPCRAHRSADEELREELVGAMQAARRLAPDARDIRLRELVQEYKGKLRAAGLNVSAAFALLQDTAKESFRVDLLDADHNVAKLLTLARNTIQTTPLRKSFEACAPLFAQALVRERRNNPRGAVTLAMQMAVFGSLVCAVGLDDQPLVQRALLRATDLAMIAPLSFVPLACLAAGLLVQHNEGPLALSLLLSTRGALELSAENFNVEQLHLNTLLFFLLHENGKAEAANELLNILVTFVRENNEKLKLMSGLTPDYSDRYVQANLLLSLGEFLTFNRVGHMAKAVIDFMKKRYLEANYELMQSHGQLDCAEEVPEAAIEAFKDTIIPVEAQVMPANAKKTSFKKINLRETLLQLKTKYMLILARLLLGAGRIGDIRSLLHRPNFLTTRQPGEEFETFKLLRFLNSGERLSGSFMQIFDPKTVDTSIPGVLSAYALSSVNSYKIPCLMDAVSLPLPQLLVCGALNGLVTQRPAETSKLQVMSKEQIIKTAQTYIPQGMYLTDNTIMQLYGLNAQSVLCNTRVAYEMLLIARCWSGHLRARPGYGGILDCPVLTGFAYERDKTFVSALSRCALRCFHIFEVLEVPVPYRAPGPDEIEIAKRIYRQSRFYQPEKAEEANQQGKQGNSKQKAVNKQNSSLGSLKNNSSSTNTSKDGEKAKMKHQESKLRQQHSAVTPKKIGKIEPLTNDYFASMIPHEAEHQINLIVPLLLHILTDPLNRRMDAADYPDPDMYILYGAYNLFSGDNCLALNAMQRGLQLDSTSQIGWLGIALTLSSQLFYQTDEVIKDKIRNKIIEALRRTDASQWLGGLDQFMVAICTALLNPKAEKSTMYAIMGLVILAYIKPLADLVPIVCDTDSPYKFETVGTAGFISQWHVKRLKAICNMSCGTQDRVAKCLGDALSCLGGIKPGTSVPEIAERILLLTETADAWVEAGNPDKAHQIMRSGLQE